MNTLLPRLAPLSGVTLACLLAAAPAGAATIGLTLDSDKDPLTVTPGESITFTVGMTPAEAITGYTLDIRYDTNELAFESSNQLVPFFSGGFTPPYTLDPANTAGDAGSNGLTNSANGRASVLQVSDSDPVGALFDLTFTVLTPANDSEPDLSVGLLDTAADDINPPLGNSPFTITPAMVSAAVGTSVSQVPVPAALWLFGSGLLGLTGIGRRKAI